MVDFLMIFPSLRTGLFGLNVLVALIYSIPIVCLRRFRSRHHLFTLNICLATICSSLYWFLFHLMFQLDPWRSAVFFLDNCRFFNILPTILTLQVPWSFVTTSINRLCAVVYHHQAFFKDKRWSFISIGCQWSLGCLLPLPLLINVELFCPTIRWHEIYKLIIIVVVPAIVFFLTNILIFLRVRNSSRRVQTEMISSIRHGNVRAAGHFSRRDLHLLRHMIVMISIFIVGWGPLFVALCLQSELSLDSIPLAILAIWCELASLCDIIDLYLYNNELRIFLRKIFLRS